MFVLRSRLLASYSATKLKLKILVLQLLVCDKRGIVQAPRYSSSFIFNTSSCVSFYYVVTLPIIFLQIKNLMR